MSGSASIRDESENKEGVVLCLKLATREEHIEAGTLHLFPNLWLPGEHVPNPENNDDA